MDKYRAKEIVDTYRTMTKGEKQVMCYDDIRMLETAYEILEGVD